MNNETVIMMLLTNTVVAGTCFYIGYTFGHHKAAAKFKKELEEQTAKFKKKLDEYSEQLSNYVLNTLLDSLKTKPVSDEEQRIKKEAYKLLDEVNQITDEQLTLLKGIDGPSKGAAFSRWRNDVIGQLKALEKDKLEKLQKVLDLGLNPKITAYVNGETVKKPLSEVLKDYYDLYPKDKETTTSTPVKPKAYLSVVKTEE